MRHVLSKLQPDLLVPTQVVPTSGHGVRGGARTVPIAAHPTITVSQGGRTAATAAAAASATIAGSTWGDSLSSLQWCGPLLLPDYPRTIIIRLSLSIIKRCLQCAQPLPPAPKTP